MKDLFPDDPTLSGFPRRFYSQGFDATAIRPIISPATQTRPKSLPIASIEVPQQQQTTPPKPYAPAGNSPKRPLPQDDSDTDGGRPRKIVRGESPLKGAAGRRLDQQKRSRQNDTPQYDGPSLPPPSPPSIPRDVLFFLSILPKTNTYYGPNYKPEAVVKLLQDTYIPKNVSELKPYSGSRGLPQPIQSFQHPPPPPPHIPHMQQIQNVQYMPSVPPMPPVPPQQYGQYNSGYPAFPSSSIQFSPAFFQNILDQCDRRRFGTGRESIGNGISPHRQGSHGLPRAPATPTSSSQNASVSPVDTTGETVALIKHLEGRFQKYAGFTY